MSLTEEQTWKMIDCNCSRPVPLKEADLTKPFVYFRKHGVFYCPFGLHQQAMATLYEFETGLSRYDFEDYNITSKFADKFIQEFNGTCFKSGVGNKIFTCEGSLNPSEFRIFSEFELVEIPKGEGDY